MALKLSERLLGGRSVLLKLSHQGISVGKLLDVPQPRNEGDFKDRAVEFRVTVCKQMRFYRRWGLSVVEGGTWADMDHGAPRGGRSGIRAAFIRWAHPDAGGVHPLAGQNLLGFTCLKVGGSKPKGPSAAIARDDCALPCVLSAHQKMRCIEVTILQPLPDFGARYGELAFDVGRDVLNIKPKGLAAGP